MKSRPALPGSFPETRTPTFPGRAVDDRLPVGCEAGRLHGTAAVGESGEGQVRRSGGEAGQNP